MTSTRRRRLYKKNIVCFVSLTHDKNIVTDNKLFAVNINLRPLGVSRIFCIVGNRNTERLTDTLLVIALSFSNSDTIFDPTECPTKYRSQLSGTYFSTNRILCSTCPFNVKRSGYFLRSGIISSEFEGGTS